MAYATVEQLTGYLAPDPTPSNAARLLDRASRDIDSALLCAVYDVDADGMPTDPEVVETLRNATLEQVSWRLDNGEDEGLPIPYGSVAIGSVRLSGPRGGGAGGGGSSGPRLGEQAEQILRAAGLLNHGPRQD